MIFATALQSRYHWAGVLLVKEVTRVFDGTPEVYIVQERLSIQLRFALRFGPRSLESEKGETLRTEGLVNDGKPSVKGKSKIHNCI